MITNDELQTLNLSPTNKDYYQVWSELLDVASKLSERWDPSSTNESDPGIVLLKVLTAIADKLNYNIDKNILEAFMPTAAQDESMRRLCDMLGYHIGYYQSATTNITIRYTGNVTDLDEGNAERLPDGTDDRGTGLIIPAFTTLSNEDKSIYYLTTQEVILTNEETIVTVPCIEGQRILCETNNSSVITMNNLDNNYRYYFPESQIAENGIFVYGTVDGQKTIAWEKVDNLNIIPNNTRAFTFNFDSKENKPYIQFPADVSFLIEDGLEIYYIRTSGAAGNVAARTINTLEKPTFGAWVDYANNENFVATNPDAALNGKNPETINQAYNGFKKTIGTFNTLVTCRDYMNKIYQLVDDQNTNYVSNIIVSDIRDDINRAHTLCSFSDYGIVYVEKTNTDSTPTVGLDKPETEYPIGHFDLVLYPFKRYQQLGSVQDYRGSFEFSDLKLAEIKAELDNYKTISHDLQTPKSAELVCIKNYLKLNARVSTTYKVNTAEETLIISNIKKALFDAFNMRELDFGEEIPYDSILNIMEHADSKIKDIVLDEPILYTKFELADGTEYDIGITDYTRIKTQKDITEEDKKGTIGKYLYNKLVLRNILAGRVELFKYDSNFQTELGEATYAEKDYSAVYPTGRTGKLTTFAHVKDSEFNAAEDLEKALNTSGASNNESTGGGTSGNPGTPGGSEGNTSGGSSDDTTQEEPGGDSSGSTDSDDTTTDEDSPGSSGSTTEGAQSGIADLETPDDIFYLQTECIKNLKPIQDNTNDYITLQKNEVVRFRAPSLKTMTPYSAYINYFLYLNTRLSRVGEAARYMSFAQLWDMPLDPSHTIGSTYYTKGKFGAEDVVGNDTFGDSFIASINEDLIKVAKSFNAECADVATIAQEDIDFGSLLYFGSNVSNIKLSDFAGMAEFATQIKQIKQAATQGCLFKFDGDLSAEKPSGNFVRLSKISDAFDGGIVESALEILTFSGMYLVVEPKSNQRVFTKLKAWAELFNAIPTQIKDEDGNIIDNPALAGKTPVQIKLNSIGYYLGEASNVDDYGFALDPGQPYTVTTAVFRALGADNKRIPGKYINTSRNKFMPANQADSSQTTAWGTYFWPCPRIKTTNKLFELRYQSSSTSLPWDDVGSLGTDGKWAYTEGYQYSSTGLDQVTKLIQPEEEYQLREGEWLFINYTPSSTTATDTASTTEAKPINTAYGPGTIIKPSKNFILEDSLGRYNSGKASWAKTSGFDFHNYDKGGWVSGMYSIGPNDQIDIRDFIRVDLKDTANLYWIIEDDICLNADNPTYILKDGEYFFYTDKNKQDMAYYGSGTELRINGLAKGKEFKFSAGIPTITMEDAIKKGVSAVPWRIVSFSADTYITFQEYQYITLTEGDMFKGLELSMDAETEAARKSSKAVGANGQFLNNDWMKVDQNCPCLYAFAGSNITQDGIELPKLNILSLDTTQAPAADASDAICWEVRSLLELNMGPNKAQVLNDCDSIRLIGKDKDGNKSVINVSTGDTALYEISPVSGGTISIKSSIPWRSSSDTVAVTSKTSTESSFSLKVFSGEPTAVSVGTVTDTNIEEIPGTSVVLPTNNFNSIWTSLSASDFNIVKDIAGDINLAAVPVISTAVAVPNDYYSLMLVYYQATKEIKQAEGLGFRFYPLVDKQYVLDKEGKYVKIFNNISADGLKSLANPTDLASCSKPATTEFDRYFDKLSWWSYSDVVTNTSTTDIAFGVKESPNINSIITNTTDISGDNVQSNKTEIPYTYFLRPGVNLLVFKNSGKFEFFADMGVSGSLIVSEVDTVRSNTNDLGLNLAALNYQWPQLIKNSAVLGSALDATETRRFDTDFYQSRRAYTLLYDILKRDPDHNFYYNCPLQAATAIDINTDLTAEDAEDLSQPKFWYDTNNINHKFVISQLDAEHIDKGVVIAKASKLR